MVEMLWNLSVEYPESVPGLALIPKKYRKCKSIYPGKFPITIRLLSGFFNIGMELKIASNG